MPVCYEAPEPTRAKYTWLKIIALRLLFPPVLLWDLLRIICSFFLGKLIGAMILSDYGTPQQEEQRKFTLLEGNNNRILQFTLGSFFNEKELSTAKKNVDLGSLTEREFFAEKFDKLVEKIKSSLLENSDSIIFLRSHGFFTRDTDELMSRLIYQQLSDEDKRRFIYGYDFVYYEDEDAKPAYGELGVYIIGNELQIKKINSYGEVELISKLSADGYISKALLHKNVLNTIQEAKTFNTLSKDEFDYLCNAFNFRAEEGVVGCRRGEDYVISLPEIVTHDDCHLQTIEVSPTRIEENNKKYMINFHGRNQSAMSGVPHSIREIINTAMRLNCTMINFSYRGQGSSTGRPESKDDLVIDGIAQVQRLLDKGVPPEDITLYGHSLGGMVALSVAKYFYRRGKSIKVIADRSPSNLTNGLLGVMESEMIKHDFSPILVAVLTSVLKPVAKLAMLLIKWEISADTAYQVLPEANKLCLVVKGEKVEGKFYEHAKKIKRSKWIAADAPPEEPEQDLDEVIPHWASLEPKRDLDEVIPHWASLYHAVKPSRLPFSKDDKETRNLKKIKSRNGFDGHRLHRNSLFSFKSRNDENVFEFIEKLTGPTDIKQSGNDVLVTQTKFNHNY